MTGKTYLTALFVTCLALSATTTLTGCNTVEGAGQDIQDGGAAIERAADDNK